ncbi:MAG: T9SS type A sorting domain-containing protein [Flavobacteriales bacterium]|nr:T9SS type A sorting domain-containing protein [Flavobacteriales bacterium]
MKNIYGIVLTTTALLFSGTVGAQSRLTLKNRSAVRTTNLVNVAALPHHGSANAQRGGGAPTNDECTGAVNQDLAVGSSVTFSGDNTGATDNGEGLTMPAVWEMFTTTECANLELSYCGTTPPFGNGFVSIYQGCPFTSNIAAGSFNDTTCTDGNFTLFYTGVPAGIYYYAVMLDSANNAVGPYTITVSASACAAPPANDECIDAEALTVAAAGDCASSMVTGNNSSSVNSTGDPTCDASTAGYQDVWYSFNSGSDTVVSVDLTNIGGTDWAFTVQATCDFGAEISCVINPAAPVEVSVTANTDYLVRVYANVQYGLGGEFTLCVSQIAVVYGYCIPEPVNGVTDGDFISNVTLGSINNATGGDNAYEDYTAQSTMLEQGASYNLSISSGDYGDDYYAAWIDYNGDSTFQATEKLGEFDGTNPQEVITLPFTVPVDAPVGITRLRVRGVYGAVDMDACTDYFYGETEDYHVDITLATGVRELNSTDVSVFPNPTQGDITISGADLSGTVNFELTDMTGRVVYKDQKSMTANQPVTLPLNGKLAQGTYSLRVITANGISSRPVMIK